MLHSVCWVLVRVFEFLVLLGILPHRQTTLQISFQPSSCEQEEPLYESPLLYNLSNLYDYSLLFINDWFALCCLKYLCLLRFLWMEPEKNKTRDRRNYEIFFMQEFYIYWFKEIQLNMNKVPYFPSIYPHGRLPASVNFCNKEKKFQQITCSGR